MYKRQIEVHLASYARGCYFVYERPRSPMSFDLPLDQMDRVGAARYMSHDELVTMVEAFPVHYHARVFRNYGHQLELYIKFAGGEHFYKYELIMPPISTSAGLSEDDPYPAPSQYYLATGKRFIERYTPAGWAAIGLSG